MFEGEQPLFNFVVPDELLAAAVAKSRDKAAVADIALMPGTGEGKPPPLWASSVSTASRPWSC